MTPADLSILQTLPPLWTTEGTETQDIVLRLRFACAWHNLTWHPVEFDAGLQVAYGLTVRMVPEWRHFSVGELTAVYGGVPVLHDGRFVGGRVPLVPSVRRHALDDISQFFPMPVPDLGLGETKEVTNPEAKGLDP